MNISLEAMVGRQAAKSKALSRSGHVNLGSADLPIFLLQPTHTTPPFLASHNFLNSSLFIKHLSTMKSAVIAALIGSAAAFAPAPVAKTTSVSYVLRLL